MIKKMIYILLFIFVFSTISSAQFIHKQTVRAEWEQVIYPTLKGWKFYASKTGGNKFAPVQFADITFVPSEGVVIAADPLYPEYENKSFNQILNLPDNLVTSGQIQRIYFKAKSVKIDGTESDFSNEAYIDLDLRPIPVPAIRCEAVK